MGTLLRENNHVFVLLIQKIKQASYKEDTRLIDMTLCKTLRKMTYLVCYQSLVQTHLIKIITKCIPFNSCIYIYFKVRVIQMSSLLFLFCTETGL